MGQSCEAMVLRFSGSLFHTDASREWEKRFGPSAQSWQAMSRVTMLTHAFRRFCLVCRNINHRSFRKDWTLELVRASETGLEFLMGSLRGSVCYGQWVCVKVCGPEPKIVCVYFLVSLDTNLTEVPAKDSHAKGLVA